MPQPQLSRGSRCCCLRRRREGGGERGGREPAAAANRGPHRQGPGADRAAAAGGGGEWGSVIYTPRIGSRPLPRGPGRGPYLRGSTARDGAGPGAWLHLRRARSTRRAGGREERGAGAPEVCPALPLRPGPEGFPFCQKREKRPRGGQSRGCQPAVSLLNGWWSLPSLRARFPSPAPVRVPSRGRREAAGSWHEGQCAGKGALLPQASRGQGPPIKQSGLGTRAGPFWLFTSLGLGRIQDQGQNRKGKKHPPGVMVCV